MRIACVGYRNWALNIYDQLAQSLDHTFLIFRSRAQFNEAVLRDFGPDLVLFYGWSWIISDDLLKDYTCLMLHPSPLPQYRGGSPLQNQILAGETSSKVSIFVMNSEIDAGDILAQEDLSLGGSLDEIFSRIEKIGAQLTLQILRDGLNPVPQDHARATFCKRRNPGDSEITLAELQGRDAKYLYNKIRMLADPYPNAFIRTIDGKKLIIKVADVDADSEGKGI
jgi:methionyl-tRNA formyltransferase